MSVYTGLRASSGSNGGRNGSNVNIRLAGVCLVACVQAVLYARHMAGSNVAQFGLERSIDVRIYLIIVLLNVSACALACG